MSFIAIDVRTNERVCTLDHDDLRPTSKLGDFVCPLCEAEMVYKRGVRVRPHFAHKVACTSDYEHKPESAAHHEGKAFVREYLQRLHGSAATVLLEVPFPEVRRVADVCADIGGWREVHEIQLAGITVADIEARTSDYHSCGASVHWWIGKRANSPAIIEWNLATMGEVHTLEVYDSAD